MIHDLLTVFPGLLDATVFLTSCGALWYGLDQYDKHTTKHHDKEN